jgi:hypothetical protein
MLSKSWSLLCFGLMDDGILRREVLEFCVRVFFVCWVVKGGQPRP